MPTRATSISRRAVLGSALGLTLASCSSDGRSPAAAGGEGGVTKVSIGVLPVVEVAPLYVGITRGIFRDHGLDVVPQQFPGGSAMVPALLGGQIRFGFSNVVSLLAARDRGVPLISVAGAGTSTGDPLRDINAVMVGRGSRLQSAKDLVGRKIAINSWNNLGDTTVKTAVRKDGGDDWLVQFVRMPFPEMPARLASGAVDAVWVPEPFRSLILSSGGRILFDNLTETYPRVQTATFFTSEQTMQDDPRLVTAFVDAVKESVTYSSAHPDEVRAILGTYTKITPAVAAMIVLPVWSAQLDAPSTTALGRAAHDFGTLSQAPDVAGLLGTP
jgi:NitT/TauT family transport system substrate-binding protein